MTRILLVDDHAIVRRGLLALLTEALPRARIDEVDRLRQSRERLVQETYDLVVLDISLPDGNGLDLLTALARLRPAPAVLVLSTYPEAEFAVQALRHGAAGYVTKASAADELVLAVRKVLAGGRYVSAALAEQLAAAIGNPAPQPLHEMLSPRELAVLRQVAGDRTSKEIAHDLGLSEKTIATYRARIAGKLGLTSKVALTRYALQHRLVD